MKLIDMIRSCLPCPVERADKRFRKAVTVAAQQMAEVEYYSYMAGFYRDCASQTMPQKDWNLYADYMNNWQANQNEYMLEMKRLGDANAKVRACHQRLQKVREKVGYNPEEQIPGASDVPGNSARDQHRMSPGSVSPFARPDEQPEGHSTAAENDPSGSPGNP